MIKYTMFSIYKTNVFLKNVNLDIKEIKEVLSKLPPFFYTNVKKIIIHNDDSMKVKKQDSNYKDSTIEINSDSCKTIKHLCKLLIHEMYHSLENQISSIFSEDYEKTCQEYLNKKHKILNIFKNDPRFASPKEEYYNDIDYSFDFDNYLLNTIGYSILFPRITDIFPSPYSLTSISEYLAVCVEVFFFENKDWLLIHCPMVFNLINKTVSFKNGKQ